MIKDLESHVSSHGTTQCEICGGRVPVTEFKEHHSNCFVDMENLHSYAKCKVLFSKHGAECPNCHFLSGVVQMEKSVPAASSTLSLLRFGNFISVDDILAPENEEKSMIFNLDPHAIHIYSKKELFAALVVKKIFDDEHMSRIKKD